MMITSVMLLCVLSGPLMAQGPIPSRPEEMKKLDFLVGQWRGEGRIDFGPGQRRTFKTVARSPVRLFFGAYTVVPRPQGPDLLFRTLPPLLRARLTHY